MYFKTKQTVTWNFLPPPCGKVILDENTIVDFLPDKKNGFVIRSKARALLAFTGLTFMNQLTFHRNS